MPFGQQQHGPRPTQMITTLTGHPLYLLNSAIISNLSTVQTVKCDLHRTRSSSMLCECQWDSGTGMRPVPGNWDGWNDDNTADSLLRESQSREEARDHAGYILTSTGSRFWNMLSVPLLYSAISCTCGPAATQASPTCKLIYCQLFGFLVTY